jgi:mRNA interferase RelE/StbE
LAWAIKYNDGALRALRRLDAVVQRRIIDFMDNRVAALDNPKRLGEALTGEFRGLWRYRVGDYRIVCNIKAAEITVIVVAVGHRSEVYDR